MHKPVLCFNDLYPTNKNELVANVLGVSSGAGTPCNEVLRPNWAGLQGMGISKSPRISTLPPEWGVIHSMC